MISLINSAGRPLPELRQQTGSCELRMLDSQIKDGAENRRRHTSLFSSVLQAGIRCTAEPADLDASCLIGSFYKNARIKYDVAAQLILNVLEMRESSADYYGTTLVLGLHPYSVEAQRRHKEEKERGGEELGRYLEKDLVSAIAEILGLHNLNLTDDFQVKTKKKNYFNN